MVWDWRAFCQNQFLSHVVLVDLANSSGFPLAINRSVKMKWNWTLQQLNSVQLIDIFHHQVITREVMIMQENSYQVNFISYTIYRPSIYSRTLHILKPFTQKLFIFFWEYVWLLKFVCTKFNLWQTQL